MQVIAPAAYPPHADMDLISACMPAVPSGSLPAIKNTL